MNSTQTELNQMTHPKFRWLWKSKRHGEKAILTDSVTLMGFINLTSLWTQWVWIQKQLMRICILCFAKHIAESFGSPQLKPWVTHIQSLDSMGNSAKSVEILRHFHQTWITWTNYIPISAFAFCEHSIYRQHPTFRDSTSIMTIHSAEHSSV